MLELTFYAEVDGYIFVIGETLPYSKDKLLDFGYQTDHRDRTFKILVGIEGVKKEIMSLSTN